MAAKESQRVVVFENPGEIDPLAIQTFGVSVKEHENPIGFFGTGLKYALAILLRTGHRVTIQSGETVLTFGICERTIRSQPFNLITMNGESMGFTDAVGKTWDLWMAYRELHCNSKDEGGSVFVADEAPEPKAGVTRVTVTGAAFAKEHENRSNFILLGDPWLKLDNCEVYDGESRGVFYRGILVHRLPKAEVSRFTYNITEHVDLTEDRTAKYSFMFPGMIAASVIQSDDSRYLREVLALPNNYYEHHFDFRNNLWGSPKPADQFLKTVEELVKHRVGNTNPSAQARYRVEKRAELEPAKTALGGVESDMLARAVKFCHRLGFPVDDYPIVVTDTLGPNILGMAENERIYVSRTALMQGTKRVAGTLTEEFIHLRYSLADETRSMQDFLVDRLMSLGEQMQGEPV